MSIARIQKAGNQNNSSSSLVITLGSVPIAGNALIAVIASDQLSGSRVSSISSTSATWTRQTQRSNTDTGPEVEIWSAFNIGSNPGAVVTITFTGTYSVCGSVAEYSGVKLANTLDRTASNYGNDTNLSSASTSQTTQDLELWISGFGILLTSVGYTKGTGWTNVDEQSTLTITSEFDEQIVSVSAVANETSTITLAAAYAGAIATFKGLLPARSINRGVRPRPFAPGRTR